MTKSDALTFRPATPELLEAFYGRRPIHSMRAHVAMIGDRVVGVGGISLTNGVPVAFSDHAEELGRRARARCFRFMEAQLAQWKGPLRAVCSPADPGSRRLLKRLGFSGDGAVMMRRTA